VHRVVGVWTMRSCRHGGGGVGTGGYSV
jgi:hypothetical protein